MTKAMHCAIQDQYTLVTWLEETAHAGSEAEIEACKADIRDFELVLAYYDDSLMTIPISNFDRMFDDHENADPMLCLKRKTYARYLRAGLATRLGFDVCIESGSEYGGLFAITCVVELANSHLFINSPSVDEGSPFWSIVVADFETNNNKLIYQSDTLDFDEMVSVIKNLSEYK